MGYDIVVFNGNVLGHDILLAIDRQEEVVLVLLDFSATYDTVEHGIMLTRLASRYGFSDSVLKWFSSYLSNRTHCVKVQEALSAPHNETCGIPQGSVMGPILYTLYSAPLHDVITAHGLHAMMYMLTTPSSTSCLALTNVLNRLII